MRMAEIFKNNEVFCQALDSLKSRLDEAAEAYGQARKQLHKEWSA